MGIKFGLMISIFSIPCIANDLQPLAEPTNAHFYYYIFTLLSC